MENTEYKTQEEIYIDWYDKAKQSENLIDVKFHAGDIQETDTEQFYREANHFNEQLDRTDLTPRIKVVF